MWQTYFVGSWRLRDDDDDDTYASISSYWSDYTPVSRADALAAAKKDRSTTVKRMRDTLAKWRTEHKTSVVALRKASRHRYVPGARPVREPSADETAEV